MSIKGKLGVLFGVASAIGMAGEAGWKSKRSQPKASDLIKKAVLEKARDVRESRNKRVADRMWKGSPEHKFKLKIFDIEFDKNGRAFGRITKSYEVL